MAEVGSTLVSSCHSEPLGEESLKCRRKQILRDKSLRMTEKWYVILSDSEVSNTDDVTQDSSGVALRMTWIVLSY